MRILPTYYASMIFMVLVGLVSPLRHTEPHCFPANAQDCLTHLLLLNAWFPDNINSWNSVTWSLSVEWTWYAVFPVAMFLFRRYGAIRGLVALTAITLVYRFGLRIFLGPIASHDIQAGLVLRTFIFGRLFEFAAGMSVAAFVASGRAIPTWVKFTAPAVLVAALLAGRLTERVDGFLPARDISYGTASAALLLLVVLPGPGILKWIFQHKLFLWLGEFSYTLYLFHLAFSTAFAMWLQSHGFTGLGLFAASFLFLPATLLACFGLYFLVERPFLVRRPKPPVAPAVIAIS